jgi:hypothetical protein
MSAYSPDFIDSAALPYSCVYFMSVQFNEKLDLFNPMENSSKNLRYLFYQMFSPEKTFQPNFNVYSLAIIL